MAEMDILMHAHTDPPISQSHHSQPSGGCPYLRSEAGHHPGFSQPPHPPPHPLTQPLPIPQLHNSHPLSGLLSPSSRGTSFGHSQQPPHSQFPHANYDPVHASGGNPWYSAPNPPFPWPSSGSVSLPPHLHPHPHPHPHSHPHPHHQQQQQHQPQPATQHSQQQQQQQQHSHPSLPQLPQARPGPVSGSNSEPPYFAGVSGGPVPVHSAGAPGAGPGPIQPGLLSNQHHFPPHHDSFVGSASTYTPFAFRQPPALLHHHRFPAISSLGQTNSSQASHPAQQQSQQQQQQQSQQQPPPPPPQHQPSLSGDRSLPPQHQSGAPHNISLPSLNPPTPPQAPTSSSPPNMSSSGSAGSGELGPDAYPPFRQSLYRRATSPPPPAAASAPEPPRPTLFGAREPSRNTSGSALSSDPEGYSAPNPPVPPNTDRRRDYTARMRLGRGHPPSDYDSDEDPSDMMETESDTLSFFEQISAGNMAFHGRDEELRIRTQQVIRGQLSNKRVASRKAIGQLQSVDISTLDESERSCVICYNEFGVPNPEGINEAPLRLPNCKHIFGDHCIKKWFEESDSCPYCRDKVPSEPVLAANSRALHQILHSFNNNPRYSIGGRADPRNATYDQSTYTYTRTFMPREESQFDSSPPRAWQTGERRSPPSEASESRRRTRARHGSFRGSPATNMGSNRPNSHAGMNSTAPLQQSPARERVNAPYQPHWGYPGTRLPLTQPLTGRQFMHMPNNQRLYGYPAGGRPPNIPVEPLGLAPPSMPQTQMGPGYGPPILSAVEDQRFQNPLNGGSGAPTPTESGQLPGPAHMATFSQPLPPVGSLDHPSFPGAPSAANGHSSAAAGDWMR